MATTYIAAIDQGTSSTRCIVFDHDGKPVAADRLGHRQVFPHPGWVEHDATEIWDATRRVLTGALDKADVTAHDIAAVGITNQRETTVVWDRSTGKPVYNAIVWQDTRTDRLCAGLAAGDGARYYREVTGLPVSTYFSGPKVRWILDHVDGARVRAAAGELLFGTVDSWLLWNLTGGPDGGTHHTDPTNASRTLMMNLRTLQWDPAILAELGIPSAMLPKITSSSQVYGTIAAPGELAGVPIAGILGDQQAATFGQACLLPGETKSTYGTGNFVLMNTGTEPIFGEGELLTTMCYQLGDAAPVYALEGSIAVTGSLVQWLRDNLGLIDSAAEVESLARSVPDNGGCYIVPAFSGLFAPYWRPDARGTIVGLTRFVGKAHLARAALEATAFQTGEVIETMKAHWRDRDQLPALKVDGGMVGNELLMQLQADILGAPVIRPVVTETTALGAAYAAGLAVGYWAGPNEIRTNWTEDKRWLPIMPPAARKRGYEQWRKAVNRSLNWTM